MTGDDEVQIVPDEVMIVGENRPAQQAARQRRRVSSPAGAAAEGGGVQGAAAAAAPVQFGLAQPAWHPAIPKPPPSPERGYKCAICLERVTDTSSTPCGYVVVVCARTCVFGLAWTLATPGRHAFPMHGYRMYMSLLAGSHERRHVFCTSCITACVQAQKKCPTCRKPLTVKQLRR